MLDIIVHKKFYPSYPLFFWSVARSVIPLLRTKTATTEREKAARRTLALVNAEGEVDWSAEYDAWGNLLNEDNPHNLQQVIRLPGQQYDKESGLYYNRHRYYDPQQGRYITQDPILFDPHYASRGSVPLFPAPCAADDDRGDRGCRWPPAPPE